MKLVWAQRRLNHYSATLEHEATHVRLRFHVNQAAPTRFPVRMTSSEVMGDIWLGFRPTLIEAQDLCQSIADAICGARFWECGDCTDHVNGNLPRDEHTTVVWHRTDW